jgi:hypothetical protein
VNLDGLLDIPKSGCTRLSSPVDSGSGCNWERGFSYRNGLLTRREGRHTGVWRVELVVITYNRR